MAYSPKEAPEIIEACRAMPKNRDASTEWPHRARGLIKRVVIHHSVTEVGENQTALEHLQAIARGHIRIANWWTIGYHWAVVDEEGTAKIYRLNPMICRTNHAGGWNTSSVGVCMIGRLHKREPTQAQVEATARLVCNLGWPAVRHKDLNQTACPGTWDWDRLKEVLFPTENRP